MNAAFDCMVADDVLHEESPMPTDVDPVQFEKKLLKGKVGTTLFGGGGIASVDGDDIWVA